MNVLAWIFISLEKEVVWSSWSTDSADLRVLEDFMKLLLPQTKMIGPHDAQRKFQKHNFTLMLICQSKGAICYK